MKFDISFTFMSRLEIQMSIDNRSRSLKVKIVSRELRTIPYGVKTVLEYYIIIVLLV